MAPKSSRIQKSTTASAARATAGNSRGDALCPMKLAAVFLDPNLTFADELLDEPYPYTEEKPNPESSPALKVKGTSGKFPAPSGETLKRKLYEPSYVGFPSAGMRSFQGATVYYAEETKDAMYVLVDMPGVPKENVKVYMDGSSGALVAKGFRGVDPRFDGAASSAFSARIESVWGHTYKASEIKAEMKDGLLRITAPKVKDEERDGVFHVQVV